MSFCSLCRVPATAEHKADGWHKFNENLQIQGKMPMSKDLYDQFERKKKKKNKKNKKKSSATTTTTTTTATAATVNKKNVNSWHWEELNYMPWAKTRIPELLKSATIPVKGNGNISITGASEITGDAYLNMRKGKYRVGFQLTIGKIQWEGEIRADDGYVVAKCKGTCKVAEFCEDTDDDEYEVTTFKLDDDDDKDEAGEMLLAVMKKEGKKGIIKQLKVFSSEMHAKKEAKKDEIKA